VESPFAELAPSLDGEGLAALLTRIMRQDQEAMASLYQCLSGRVYALALRITRQVAGAEEVMQDTFWQVWRQAPRFDPCRGSAIAWVLTIARSRALDRLRASAHDVLESKCQHSEEPIEFADSDADPMDLLLAVERDSCLHAVLETLDPLKRQLIALAFYRGWSHEEIAAGLELPLGTVKSHFRRTLAAMKPALERSLNPTGAVQ
jgi:RNA polymerase sigma factor (sigma-70 family)